MCTFKLDEQLLGKAPQIALQIVPPASDAFHLLAQVEDLLLLAGALLVGFVQRRFQLGILFFQLADRSQFLFSQSGPVVSLLASSSQILILLRRSFSQFFCKEMMIDSEIAEGCSSRKLTSRQTCLTSGAVSDRLQFCPGQLQVKFQLNLLPLQISEASSKITRFLKSKGRNYSTAKNDEDIKY